MCIRDRDLVADFRAVANTPGKVAIVYYVERLIQGYGDTGKHVAILIVYPDPDNPYQHLRVRTGESVPLDDHGWPEILSEDKPAPEKQRLLEEK